MSNKDSKKPNVPSTWIPKEERLPEHGMKVMTLTHGREIITNSIQIRNHTLPCGKIVELDEWEKKNLEITHWLEGFPKLPKNKKKDE